LSEKFLAEKDILKIVSCCCCCCRRLPDVETVSTSDMMPGSSSKRVEETPEN
jgi:hypothetical protein